MKEELKSAAKDSALRDLANKENIIIPKRITFKDEEVVINEDDEDCPIEDQVLIIILIEKIFNLVFKT